MDNINIDLNLMDIDILLNIERAIKNIERTGFEFYEGELNDWKEQYEDYKYLNN